MPDILYSWGCSSYFGWGVVGLNMMLHWPGTAMCVAADPQGVLATDDPRAPLMHARIAQSQDMRRRLLATGDTAQKVDLPLLCTAINPNFERIPLAPGRYLSGTPTVCWVMFEDADAASRNAQWLSMYDAVWTGCDWNTEILTDAGIAAITVHQGVDCALFNTTAKQKRSDGRFRVFSGGKCEWRKGQDLVIAAFRQFADRHDDVVLVCAWGSPWPGLAREFANAAVGSVPGADIGLPNYSAWLQRNGIAAHQIEIVPRLPNCAMPAIYGSCDVGLFASRSEGGTNLMAMECMACGVPAILTDVGGHADLPTDSSVEVNPDADELRGCLEYAYTDGLCAYGEDMAAEWDWPVRCQHMVELLEDM